jgi:hypothetical protein
MNRDMTKVRLEIGRNFRKSKRKMKYLGDKISMTETNNENRNIRVL